MSDTMLDLEQKKNEELDLKKREEEVEENYCEFCGTDEVTTFCKCNDSINQYSGE